MATVSFQPSISWKRMQTMKQHDLTSRERRNAVLYPFFFFGSGPRKGKLLSDQSNFNSSRHLRVTKCSFFSPHSFLHKQYYHCCHDDHMTSAKSPKFNFFFKDHAIFQLVFLHICFQASLYSWNNNIWIYSKVLFASFH